MDFLHVPFAKDSCPCSYYPKRNCTQIFNLSQWLEGQNFFPHEGDFPIRQYYGFLKRNGFCRYNSMFYKYECADCKECCAVRIPVNQFKPSKTQKNAWNKNQDICVTIAKNPDDFVTEEKAFLFREYDAYHNSSQEGFQKKTIEEALSSLKEMNTGYSGTWNMEYRLGNRLIGVGIIDFTEDENGKINSICSNYFYYDVSQEFLKRSLGTFSALKELELCKSMDIPYYYLGLFLVNCHKMNYKINFEPYELLINNVWLSSNLDLPKPGSVMEEFPDVCFVTNDISIPVLIGAYKHGIFPWFNEDEGEPVVWQSPDPKFVIDLNELHIPKTLKKFLKHNPFTYTMDTCFEEVIKQCSLMQRQGQNGTWIGKKMIDAYIQLHKLGYAHSIEVWHDDKLVGGFYGEQFGSIFCGESMFTIESYSSSSAFALFSQKFKEAGGKYIDCQAYTDNMSRYGAKEIPRDEYLKILKKYMKQRIDKPQITQISTD